MKRRRPPDEPGFRNRRTDAESYADHALSIIPGIGRVDEDRRGYIRDTLAEAFSDGESQGICHALRIIAIARGRTASPKTAALLLELSYMIAPHLRPEGD